MSYPTQRHITTFAVSLIVLAMVVLPTIQAEADEGTQRRSFSPKKSPREECALLDDPVLRSRMDGLLFRLAMTCGRQELLGQVRQEPNMDAGDGESRATDSAVNDPSGDTGTTSHTQSETSLAVSGSTGTVCSGYNDSWHYYSSSEGFAGFSRSTDGGATFTDQGPLGAASGGDPAVVWSHTDDTFGSCAVLADGDHVDVAFMLGPPSGWALRVIAVFVP